MATKWDPIAGVFVDESPSGDVGAENEDVPEATPPFPSLRTSPLFSSLDDSEDADRGPGSMPAVSSVPPPEVGS